MKNKTKDKDDHSFIASNKNERIEYITEIIKRNKESVGSGGLRNEAIELVNGIERAFHLKLKTQKENKEVQFILEELSSAREFLGTPGASVKMILEHIALVI